MNFLSIIIDWPDWCVLLIVIIEYRFWLNASLLILIIGILPWLNCNWISILNMMIFLLICCFYSSLVSYSIFYLIISYSIIPWFGYILYTAKTCCDSSLFERSERILIGDISLFFEWINLPFQFGNEIVSFLLFNHQLFI